MIIHDIDIPMINRGLIGFSLIFSQTNFILSTRTGTVSPTNVISHLIWGIYIFEESNCSLNEKRILRPVGIPAFRESVFS